MSNFHIFLCTFSSFKQPNTCSRLLQTPERRLIRLVQSASTAPAVLLSPAPCQLCTLKLSIDSACIPLPTSLSFLHEPWLLQRFNKDNRVLMEGAWDEPLIYYLRTAAQCKPIGFITGSLEKLICLWGLDVPADSRAELWWLLLMFISGFWFVRFVCFCLHMPSFCSVGGWPCWASADCALS